MAKEVYQKKGLTTFGWLALIGVGAAVLGSKERRGKLVDAVKGYADKLNPRGAATGPSESVAQS